MSLEPSITSDTHTHNARKVSSTNPHTHRWCLPLCRQHVHQTHCVSVQQQVVKDSGLGWGHLVTVLLIRYVHYMVSHLTALKTKTHLHLIVSGSNGMVVWPSEGKTVKVNGWLRIFWSLNAQLEMCLSHKHMKTWYWGQSGGHLGFHNVWMKKHLIK